MNDLVRNLLCLFIPAASFQNKLLLGLALPAALRLPGLHARHAGQLSPHLVHQLHAPAGGGPAQPALLALPGPLLQVRPGPATGTVRLAGPPAQSLPSQLLHNELPEDPYLPAALALAATQVELPRDVARPDALTAAHHNQPAALPVRHLPARASVLEADQVVTAAPLHDLTSVLQPAPVSEPPATAVLSSRPHLQPRLSCPGPPPRSAPHRYCPRSVLLALTVLLQYPLRSPHHLRSLSVLHLPVSQQSSLSGRQLAQGDPFMCISHSVFSMQ